MRLVAENLSGERGDNLLFNSLCASLSDGQALIVTGPNGAGKSTLLRIIAGLLPASDGTVWLETDGEQEPVMAHSHYLSTLNAMKPALSVYENLKFWQDFHGSPLHDIDEALEIVGLYNIDHLPYGYLSTGQKRRVTIATLLCSHRPLWLLDEPTSGLDTHLAIFSISAFLTLRSSSKRRRFSSRTFMENGSLDTPSRPFFSASVRL